MEAPLSEVLTAETRGLRLRALRAPFLSQALRGNVDRVRWAAFLAELRPVHQALEAGLHTQADREPYRGFGAANLGRSEHLSEDLEALGCSPDASGPLGTELAERLQICAFESPHRLLGHAFVRDRGDVIDARQLAPALRSGLEGHGLGWLAFEVWSPPLATLEALMVGLDGSPWSRLERAEILEEARLAYLHLIEVFESLARSS